MEKSKAQSEAKRLAVMYKSAYEKLKEENKQLKEQLNMFELYLGVSSEELDKEIKKMTKLIKQIIKEYKRG